MDELERREVSGPHEKANTPSSAHGKLKPATHRNWQDDLGIASQVSDVAVEGHPLLHSTSSPSLSLVRALQWPHCPPG